MKISKKRIKMITCINRRDYIFLIRRLKTKKSEMFLMPSGRAFQSSTAWQTNRCWPHKRFGRGLQTSIIIMHVFKMIKIQVPIDQTVQFKDVKIKNSRWDLRLFSNVSQPSRSRASVADECFGIFKINLVALFWSNWILFISVALDLSSQVISA